MITGMMGTRTVTYRKLEAFFLYFLLVPYTGILPYELIGKKTAEMCNIKVTLRIYFKFNRKGPITDTDKPIILKGGFCCDI
jgi:hypothetical protein